MLVIYAICDSFIVAVQRESGDKREGGIEPVRAAETDSAKKSRILRSCIGQPHTFLNNQRDLDSEYV